MVLTMIVTGMTEVRRHKTVVLCCNLALIGLRAPLPQACFLIATALLCRIIFRIGNKPIVEGDGIIFRCGTVTKPASRCRLALYNWRLAFSWLLNFMFFAGGLWYVSAIALCYGQTETDSMLMGWVTSTCISWFLMEPGFIFLIVMLPCLCRNSVMDLVYTRMNDIGCDLSMFLG